ncbi:helix-turn-helix domain-containing protein [Aquidulcibacter sp.]|uniref:helix-turn-helix domain-containing protein n=1 Tax=Aquidulcibacter sp. TaxID=2052990 RepID=UPI0025C6A965|nr:helix-turn-helix domain-containing protein [Aquidulcibacter sp.]MCA3693213.1 helix-turn-helix domain-containing protein [Aquidulcibacter sp.]
MANPLLQTSDMDLFMSRPRNRPFFNEGDPSGAIYQVESGCVRLQKMTEGGRRCVLSFCYPGDVFGLGTHGPEQVDAEAACASRVARLGHLGLQRMLQSEPTRAMKVIDAAYGGQEPGSEHVVMISFAPAEQKLAWFLAGLGQRLGQSVAGELLVDLPMMRADIADYLGMTFETVSREMTKLRDLQIIDLLGLRKFKIQRAAALQSLALRGSIWPSKYKTQRGAFAFAPPRRLNCAHQADGLA